MDNLIGLRKSRLTRTSFPTDSEVKLTQTRKYPMKLSISNHTLRRFMITDPHTFDIFLSHEIFSNSKVSRQCSSVTTINLFITWNSRIKVSFYHSSDVKYCLSICQLDFIYQFKCIRPHNIIFRNIWSNMLFQYHHTNTHVSVLSDGCICFRHMM